MEKRWAEQLFLGASPGCMAKGLVYLGCVAKFLKCVGGLFSFFVELFRNAERSLICGLIKSRRTNGAMNVYNGAYSFQRRVRWRY